MKCRAAMLGFSELLASSGNIAAKDKEHVRIIRRNCDYLLEIVNTMLDLAKLEAQDRGQTAKALADDLPLFAVPSRAAAEPAPPSEAEQLVNAVKALHPDEMSPREALEALYALKAKLPT